MSNEKHKIDELFRQKLGNYELEAPDHVWRNIEAKRSALHKAINYFKNKRATVTIAAMLLVASLAYMSFAEIGSSPDTAGTEQQTVTAAIPGTDASAAGNTAESTVHTATPAANTTSAPVNVAASTAYSAPAGNQSTGNENTGNGAAGNGGGTTSATEGSSNTSENNNNTPAITPENIETPVLTTTPPANGETTANTLTTEAPAAALAEGEPNETPSPDKAEEAKKQEKTTVKPDRMRKWSMDVYASGDVAGRSLHASGLSQQYINERNYAERFQPGFTIGARVNYDLNRNGMLKLRTGFQYSRINEKVNFTRSYTTTRIDTLTGVVIDPVTGQPIGTTTRIDTTEQTVTNAATAQNSYTFIDLPVQLEIALFKNERWNLFATGGAAINLRFTQNGGMLNPDLNGLKELNAANTPYKTNAGISLLAGMGAEYRLCGNFSVLVEAQYRQGLTSVFKSGTGMDQTFRTISAGAGLRYRF